MQVDGVSDKWLVGGTGGVLPTNSLVSCCNRGMVVGWVAGLQERVRLCHGQAHAQSLRPASRSRLQRCMRVRGNFALESSRCKLRGVAFVARATGIRCCPCVAEMGGGGAAGTSDALRQTCTCFEESLDAGRGAGVETSSENTTVANSVATQRQRRSISSERPVLECGTSIRDVERPPARFLPAKKDVREESEVRCTSHARQPAHPPTAPPQRPPQTTGTCRTT